MKLDIAVILKLGVGLVSGRGIPCGPYISELDHFIKKRQNGVNPREGHLCKHVPGLSFFFCYFLFSPGFCGAVTSSVFEYTRRCCFFFAELGVLLNVVNLSKPWILLDFSKNGSEVAESEKTCHFPIGNLPIG